MRILKWTGGILLALLVLLALFIAFGLSTLKGPITRAVSNATGRELIIDGRLKPVWTWVHPRFRAEKVTFGNADWATEDLMFQADAQGVSFKTEGIYKGLPAAAEGRGGQVLALKDTGTPYPIDATAMIGATHLKAKGTLTNVAQLSALDLAVELRGKTLSELYDII